MVGTLSESHRDNPLEVVEIERLIDISERAELESLAGTPRVGISSDHDRSGGRIDRAESFEQFNAVHSGQRDVEQTNSGRERIASFNPSSLVTAPETA